MNPLGAIMRGMPRGLLRSPLFTLTTLLTLAIGIGANVALFSVVDGILLKPLPFDEADRLVGVWHAAPGMNIPQLSQGPAFHLTYRDENRVFEHIGMWNNRSVTLTGVGEPEWIPVLMVTEGTLPALRVRPFVGRTFSREDDAPGSPERAILMYAYWQRKFGGDRAIVGRRLIVDGTPREVIGVLPDGFDFFGIPAAMLLPMRLDPAEVFVGNFAHRGLARLRPGVTMDRANADIARTIPLVVERFPMPAGFTRDMLGEIRLGPNVHPLADDVIGDVGPVLWLLLGAVGLVLLIACANVANLFLVRCEERQQELAVRSALGASWARLAGELLAESVSLGLLGGALGVGLAWASLRMLVAMAPASLPRLNEIAWVLSPGVLLFTCGISMLAGGLFGVLPILRLARPRLAALKDGGRSASDGRGRHRTRSVLVIAEIALAVVLLVGSGLMIRSFQSLRQVDPGFIDPQDVLTLRISIPEAMAANREQAARMHEQIVHRIEQTPGVISVGLSSSITMEGVNSRDPVFVEDIPTPAGQIPPMHTHKWISPRYFETMGNRLIAGRALTWADVYGRPPVALVSDTLARGYWKTPAAAVGRRVRETPKSPWREVIGVVGSERDDGAAQPAPMVVYWPFLMEQFWGETSFVQRTMAYAIRTNRMNSPDFMKEIQQAVWSVNTNVPLANVRTLDEIRSRSMARTSFALVMLAIAAIVALLLAVVGIYGAIAYIAARRTREVGIRVALGAQPPDVVRLFVRHSAVLAGLGIVVGLSGAAALSRLMSSLLFGVGPLDPVTYLVVSVGLAAIALLAGYLPARRASRLDPVVALRSDA